MAFCSASEEWLTNAINLQQITVAIKQTCTNHINGVQTEIANSKRTMLTNIPRVHLWIVAVAYFWLLSSWIEQICINTIFFIAFCSASEEISLYSYLRRLMDLSLRQAIDIDGVLKSLQTIY